MRKFTKAAAMLCAAAMVIPSASVFAAEDGGASELTEVGTYPISEEPLEFTMFRHQYAKRRRLPDKRLYKVHGRSDQH